MTAKVTTEITRHELEGYRMMLSGDLKKAKEFLHQESSDAIAELAYSALCYKSYLSSLVKAADKVDKAFWDWCEGQALLELGLPNNKDRSSKSAPTGPASKELQTLAEELNVAARFAPDAVATLMRKSAQALQSYAELQENRK